MGMCIYKQIYLYDAISNEMFYLLLRDGEILDVLTQMKVNLHNYCNFCIYILETKHYFIKFTYIKKLIIVCYLLLST